jgi:hypothetical protein
MKIAPSADRARMGVDWNEVSTSQLVDAKGVPVPGGGDLVAIVRASASASGRITVSALANGLAGRVGGD